jgi:hypothetical protein
LTTTIRTRTSRAQRLIRPSYGATKQLGPALGEAVGAALSLGYELSASHGAFSLSTLGERLGDELGVMLGESLSDYTECSSDGDELVASLRAS